MEYTQEEKEKIIDQMAQAQAKRIVYFLEALNKRKEAMNISELRDLNMLYGSFLKDRDNEENVEISEWWEKLDNAHIELAEWWEIYEKTRKNWNIEDHPLQQWIRRMM